MLLFLGAMPPLYAARPYHTDDPGTTEQGKFEAELCVDFWKNIQTPGFVFKHGITERMELDIPLNYHVLPDRERGTSPAQIYLKFALIPDRFAATFTSTFGDPAFAINTIYAKTIRVVTLTANLGGSMVGNTNDVDLTYGASAVFTINRFETGAEFTGTQEELDWWGAGIRFFCTDWLSIDAGIGGNFERNMTMNITTGLCFAFPIDTKQKKEE
jgi:hypothetical protein